MRQPFPWLPVALISLGVFAAGFFLGTRPGQSGWMSLAWFALCAVCITLAGWADERWPGPVPEPPPEPSPPS